MVIATYSFQCYHYCLAECPSVSQVKCFPNVSASEAGLSLALAISLHYKCEVFNIFLQKFLLIV